MAASRRRRLGIAATLVGALVACDAAIGLNDYTSVPCAFDCGAPDAEVESDVRDAAVADHWDGDAADGDAEAAESDAPTDDRDGADVADADVADADADDGDVADADVADVVSEADAPVPPSPTEIWAHWPMPNPDASIGPESSTPLPNPMAYDASDETVGDLVTKLAWQRVVQRSTYDSAQASCRQWGVGWRLPTRIELVSLIDFTQQGVLVDPTAFPGVPTDVYVYWTSSIVAPDAGAHWTVNFQTGDVKGQPDTLTGYCRCVLGGS